MALKIDWLTIDTSNPEQLAEFWSKALGYPVVYDSKKEDPESTTREIALAENGPDGEGWRILILEVHDPKTVKNRLHLDLRPDDQDAEVARLEGLGAKKTDIGQGDVTWVVMADPDGNEFCILRPRKPGEDD